MFEEVNFHSDTVRRRIRELAYLNKGVRFVFTDERIKDADKRTYEYCYDGGMADFVQYLNTDKTTITEPILFEATRDGLLVRVAIQYTDSYTESIYSFVNNVPTPEGGTHETGFKTALTRVINDYARKNNILKEADKNLSGEDVREGLTAIISVKMEDAQFESQTKAKLGNTEIGTLVNNVVLDKLNTYFEENPAVARGYCDHRHLQPPDGFH